MMIKVAMYLICISIIIISLSLIMSYRNVAYADPLELCCNNGLCNEMNCGEASSMNIEPYCSAISSNCFECIDRYYKAEICETNIPPDYYCVYWTGARWAEYRGGPINYEK